MSNRLIVLVASPSVRTKCPPEYREGMWLEVPEEVKQVQLGALSLGALRSGREDDHLEVAPLLAKPNGKMVRRDDGVSAPVFEVRYAEDW